MTATMGANVRARSFSYREVVSSPDRVALPELPTVLLDPRPVVGVGTLLWVIATLGAFVVPTLQSWRPVTVAGLGVSVFGASLFLWQRAAAQRGARGAQTGLERNPPQ